MTRKSQALAHVLIAGVILGSAYDIASRQEHWPFSNYSMFAAINRATVLEWPGLFGVTADGSEIALDQPRSRQLIGEASLPLDARDR